MRQNTTQRKVSGSDNTRALAELKHFVRVTGVRSERFVEFDFSIGDPQNYIELVLPFDQYKQFCEKHNAVELTREQAAAVDFDKLKWRYGEPGINQ